MLFWFCFFYLLLFRSLCWLLVLGHNSAISHLLVVGGRGERERGEERMSEVVMIMVVVMSASAITNLLEEAKKNNK